MIATVKSASVWLRSGCDGGKRGQSDCGDNGGRCVGREGDGDGGGRYGGGRGVCRDDGGRGGVGDS